MALTFRIRVTVALFLLLALVVYAPYVAAQENVTLRLDWIANGYHAPFFLALEQGYYKEVGLDVKILEGKGSTTVIQLVGQGVDTFAYADSAAAAKAATLGVPVINVMGILKKTLMAVFYTKASGVKSLSELKGKTLTVSAGDAPSLLLPALLKANNIPVDSVKLLTVDVGAKFRTVADGRADGTVSYALSDAIFEAMGVQTSRFDYADSGIQIPAFGIVANTKTLKQSPNTVRRFLQATARGWKQAQRDPDGAVAALAKNFPLVRGKEPEYHRMLSIALRYIDTPNTVGKPFGWMSDDDWKRAEDMLVEYLQVQRQPSVSAYFTNEYLSN
jgi:NitT/TauT family transport system substrate-binding protein